MRQSCVLGVMAAAAVLSGGALGRLVAGEGVPRRPAATADAGAAATSLSPFPIGARTGAARGRGHVFGHAVREGSGPGGPGTGADGAPSAGDGASAARAGSGDGPGSTGRARGRGASRPPGARGPDGASDRGDADAPDGRRARDGLDPDARDGESPGSPGTGRDGESTAEALEPPPPPPEEPQDDRPPPGTGLLAEYWKLVDKQIGDFPDVHALGAPTVSRVDPRIEFRGWDEFRLPFVNRNLAVRWRGYIYAPDDGVYTFLMGSDDGSHLLLDGVPAIDLGGLHGFVEAQAEVALLRGLHPIEVRFFNNEGPGGCVLAWAPPGGPLEIIPPDVLYPAGAPVATARTNDEAAETPRIESVVPPRARHGERVTIIGRGFGDPGIPHRVTFGGVDLRITSLEPRAIVAELPPGIDVADIVVWVAERPGPGFLYEVGDVFGLLAEYVPGNPDVEMRTLADMPPPGGPGAFLRVEPRISFHGASMFALPFPARRFGARYRGSLYVPVSGARRIEILSDDGSRLWLDGGLIIDNDGLHPMHPNAAVVELARGFHEIAIDFFENEGYEGLVLRWETPGGSLSEVPRANLYPAAGIGFVQPTAPEIESVTPPEAPEGAEVEIVGRGFAADGRSDRVTIAGREAPIVAVGPARLTIRVPAGARSGPLVVQTGLLASRPVDFTVLGYGLTAAYFKYDEPLTVIPNVDTRVPDVERVEPRLAFGEDYSFQLPFDTERFAARFTGEIETRETGTHTFHLTSDDGARLLIDGRVVVDNDGLHPPHTEKGDVQLEAGRHRIRVDFFENGGFATLRLDWTLPSGRGGLVPERAYYPER